MTVLATTRAKARLRGARIDLRVAPDVRFGPRVRISVDPGSGNVVEIGQGCELHEDVLVLLRGGTLRMGPGSSFRRGCVLNLAGTLELRAGNIFSFYCTIHCSDRITVESGASASEFVTLIDSRHFHDDSHAWFADNVESAAITIGPNAWLAAKSTVSLGVTVGADAVVGAHAMVTRDVPPRAMVGGVPAKVLRTR